MTTSGDDGGFRPHPGDPWHPEWEGLEAPPDEEASDEVAFDEVPSDEAPSDDEESLTDEPERRRGLFGRRKRERDGEAPAEEAGATEDAPPPSDPATPTAELQPESPTTVGPTDEGSGAELPGDETFDETSEPAWMSDGTEDAAVPVVAPSWSGEDTLGSTAVEAEGFEPTDVQIEDELEPETAAEPDPDEGESPQEVAEPVTVEDGEDDVPGELEPGTEAEELKEAEEPGEAEELEEAEEPVDAVPAEHALFAPPGSVAESIPEPEADVDADDQLDSAGQTAAEELLGTEDQETVELPSVVPVAAEAEKPDTAATIPSEAMGEEEATDQEAVDEADGEAFAGGEASATPEVDEAVVDVEPKAKRRWFRRAATEESPVVPLDAGTVVDEAELGEAPVDESGDAFGDFFEQPPPQRRRLFGRKKKSAVPAPEAGEDPLSGEAFDDALEGLAGAGLPDDPAMEAAPPPAPPEEWAAVRAGTEPAAPSDEPDTGPVAEAQPDEQDPELADEPEPAVAADPDEPTEVMEVPFDPQTEDDEDWVTGPIDVDSDDLHESLYAGAVTTEHRDLAEVIAAHGEEETQLQALSAQIPGVDSGVVGFDDVADLGDDEEVAAPARSDLGARILTAGVLVGLLFGTLWVSGEAMAVFVGLLMMFGLGEFYGTLRKRGYRPIALFGLLGGAGALGLTWWHGPIAIPGAIVSTAVLTFFFYAFVPQRRDALTNAGLTVLGMGWIAGTAAFAIPIFASEDYRVLVFGVVAATAAMDVGAYFFGRAWGSSPLAPVLSPNKSIEGLAGGVIMSVAAAVAIGQLMEPFDIKTGAALGLVVAIAAPLGDLAESMLKRSLGVKDMGSVLPGHGGVLDRVDAFLFVLPPAWVLFAMTGLLS